MSNSNKYEILEVNSAKEKIDEFFSQQQELADEFYRLLQYIKSQDSEIVLRYNDDIIGASKPESVFHFYVSFNNNNDTYYIKFKNSKIKTPFSPILRTTYEIFCRQVVELINDNPKYKLEPIKEKTGDNINLSDIMPVFITECDEALDICRNYFKKHKDFPITPEIFGARASNGMKRRGITTLGELAAFDAADLYKIRNMGKKSITDITKGCYTVLSLFGDKLPPNRLQNNKTWESVNEKTIRVIDIYTNYPYYLLNKQERINAFVSEVESFFTSCLLRGPFLTQRQRQILYMRNIEGKTLQNIADEYGLSRERIRQICKNSEKRFILYLRKGIKKYPIISEFVSKIEGVSDSEFLEHMVFVKRNNQFIWECLLSLVTDKNTKGKLQDLIDNYDRSIPEEVSELDYLEENNNTDDSYIEQIMDEENSAKALLDDAKPKKRTRTKPSRAGEPWTAEEDLKLKEEFNGGMKQSQIAKEHGRTSGAIRARLIKHGLIDR